MASLIQWVYLPSFFIWGMTLLVQYRVSIGSVECQYSVSKKAVILKKKSSTEVARKFTVLAMEKCPRGVPMASPKMILLGSHRLPTGCPKTKILAAKKC